MRTMPISWFLALTLSACAASDGAPPKSATPGIGAGTPGALFSATEPAPAGSALRLFVDPEQLVGWIAGSKSFVGEAAVIRIDGHEHRVAIGDDNTFAFPVSVEKALEATVTVGGLWQRVTLEPRETREPTAYVVADRSAYRPGQI